MNSSAQRSFRHQILAASRPARSTLPAIAAAEARQRQLRLVHSARLPSRPAPCVRTTKTLGLLLALGAAALLILG
jgi:hypothetical protein